MAFVQNIPKYVEFGIIRLVVPLMHSILLQQTFCHVLKHVLKNGLNIALLQALTGAVRPHEVGPQRSGTLINLLLFRTSLWLCLFRLEDQASQTYCSQFESSAVLPF